MSIPWSIPRALYEHVHRTFHADLDATAAGQVSDFLSEQVLRGTLPMQVDGGIYSPVITDADGNAVGMLHLVTTPTVGTPLRQSTPGQINLESHLVNTAKVDLSSKYTSGIGVSGSAAAALTGDHSQGHPDASRHHRRQPRPARADPGDRHQHVQREQFGRHDARHPHQPGPPPRALRRHLPGHA
ncbi:hypothetical protein ACQ86D_38480 [Streptomyces galilaeus]